MRDKLARNYSMYVFSVDKQSSQQIKLKNLWLKWFSTWCVYEAEHGQVEEAGVAGSGRYIVSRYKPQKLQTRLSTLLCYSCNSNAWLINAVRYPLLSSRETYRITWLGFDPQFVFFFFSFKSLNLNYSFSRFLQMPSRTFLRRRIF